MQPMIYIKWRDHFVSSGWQYIYEAEEDHEGVIVESVGFLMSESKDTLRIAISVCEETETCAHVVTILKKTVLERKEIPFPKKKGNKR